jgi:hypothetical protein
MNDVHGATERLFSYGTLQLESVQRSLFGRALEGVPDTLPMYEAGKLAITDPDEVASTGKTHHAIAMYTGRESDSIAGMVLSLTPAELLKADEYEIVEYKRISVDLRSGTRSWVYVDAR